MRCDKDVLTFTKQQERNAGEPMAKNELSTMGSKSFEDLKKVNEHGAEYWSARELQPHLGYTQWRRFEDAIKRAITSCEQSGNEPSYHFAGVGKMIDIGKGGSREVQDSRKRWERSSRCN